MNTTNKYQIDMTHGPLFSKIVLFSLPLMSSYVMQVLFNTVDLVVIGRFASREAMAAVGATSGLTVLVLNIFFGLSVGVNVLAARYVGAKDRKNVAATIHTAAAVGLYGGLIMAAIGILVSRPDLRWMATPPEILGKSSLYMWIYCSSIPFIILYNFGSSILRAQGDTRRPLYFMIIGGLVKVLLDLLLVLNIFFGLSVGVNVLAARYIGAKDRKNVAATIHTAVAVGLYGGLIMA
ncbi:MAG: polysaccharide biosynthesis C-terminal domain-containing protein, partial [Lentisphaeria bacterium]|nr:polysaccharide biosynthesis C-terminal domain-containing protein [Lentisphaeria bacterium]